MPIILSRAMTAFLFFTCCLACIMACQQPLHKQRKDLSGLQGAWMMEGKEKIYGERWVKLPGDSLRGLGYSIKQKDTSFLEEVILTRKDGKWTYTPKTIGQGNGNPVTFTLTVSKQREYVFENPKHDFPKRIIYRFVGRDSIHASIDDGTGSADARMDFYYRRVK